MKTLYRPRVGNIPFPYRLVMATLFALVAARADAQSPPVPLDTLNLRNDLHEAVMALPADTVVAFCAPQFRRDRSRVFIDWWNPTADPTNPLCGPREAHVLVRPSCVFTLAEFLQLRVRALYVVLICRPNAFGIPLHEPPPLERITESAGRVG